ncbi:MAG: cation:proton antiporter [Firmicutes bacterium]|nr:cation:proton antiporter [Bacillota bacterium]MDD3852010.1 cation:proton antiporter [Bacillota bacterium]
MEVIMYFSIILFAGYVAGRVISLFNLPVVTGYLVVGILIGPYCLDIVPDQAIHSLELIEHIALSFIAFFIGSEFEKSQLMGLGSSVFIIAVVQALGTVALVFITMRYIFLQPLSFSLLIGAISAATAPAAVLMVIKEYRAKGPLTRTLLSVVALDDVICVIVFGIIVSLVTALNGGEGLSVGSVSEPLVDIFGSVLLGLLAAAVTYIFVIGVAKTNEDILTIILAVLIGTTAAAYRLGLSYILTDMFFGAVIANTNRRVTKVFSIIEPITQPIYVAFFTLAGLTLQLDILPQVGLVGAGYVLARAAGKMAGCYFGARLGNAPGNVKRYLGLGMLPQAGVAIGLALTVRQRFPDIGLRLSTIVMAGVVFYEILGPLFAKLAIQKSGETNKRG